MRLLVKDIGKQKVYIGFRGEQNYAEIAFDFSNIFAEYPDADVAMRIKPPEGETYPHSLTREENIVVWHVNASDCATDGMGSYQVTFTSGNTIVKSFVGLYVVRGSLDVTGDPPDPYVSWLEELEEIATDVHHEIEDAKETMSGYLEESEDARDTAVASAEAAVAANESAQTAAQAANTKAFEATEAARTATSKANEANVSAMMAENYKTTAVNAASQAASAANTAMQSATVATTKATEAANSAASALNSKTAAETSAATASQASAAAVAANTEVQEAKEIVVAAKDTTVAAKDRVEELVESLPDNFDALVEDVAKLKTDVGDTTELETETKTDLVSAVNEVHGDLSGKADLENGKVPASQLPSYVDDVLEYSSFSAFPVTGETGKIYVALDTNNVYRWSGSTYIQINDVLELIDDEAGLGDTEKVWSADKLATEVANLTELINAKPDIDDTAGLGDTDKAWSADKITQELDSLDPTLTESIESTAVAVFDDGAEDLPLDELRVEINPVQDLHGYDKPWVGGAGANLIPDGTDTTNGFIDNRYISASGNTFSDTNYYVSEYFPVVAGQGYMLSNSGGTMNSPAIVFYDSSKTFISGVGFNYQTSKAVTAPENAAYARCTQSRDFSTKIIQFEKGDTATTPTPYKNICPISGWTGVEIVDTGKNLWNGKFISSAYAENDSYSSTYNCVGNYAMECKVGKQYTFSIDGVATQMRYAFLDANKSRIASLTNATTTVEAPSDAVYLQWRSYDAVSSGEVKAQIEEGTSASDYTPYAEQTYPIQFPSEAGTVFSGYLTVHKDGTGEVVADSAQVDLTGKVFATTQQTSSSGRFSLSVGNNPTLPNPLDRNAEIISSHYKGIVESEIDLTSPWVFCASDSIVIIQTADTSLDTGTKLGAFLTAQSNAGTPVTICYKIKTPVSFPLTTTQVRTLLGYNAISADSGNVALTYRKDSEVNYELARLEEKIDSRPEIINDETVADDSVWSSEKVDHLTTTEQETVSGDIVTFETDAEQLLEQITVSIAPVQDLHGYDSPWVGGAGKNLAPLTVALMKEANTHGTWTGNTYADRGLTYVVNTDDAGNVISITLSGTATSNGGFYFIPDKTYQFTIGAESKMTLSASANIGGGFEFHTNTTSDTDYKILGTNMVSGEVTLPAGTYYRLRTYVAKDTVITATTFYPMIRLATDTDATFAPYENICPITGWDGVKVQRKNLPIIFDSVGAVENTDYVNGRAYDVNTGAISTVQGYMIFTGYAKCIPGETYYLYGNKSATQSRGVYVSYYDVNQNFLSFANPIANTSSTGIIRGSFTVPTGVAYMRFTTPTLVADSFFVSDGVEIPADYTYAGQTYPISFPSSAGTIYGGTLTINRDGSGSLVVDRANVDMGLLTYEQLSSGAIKVTKNNIQSVTGLNPIRVNSGYVISSVVTMSQTANEYRFAGAGFNFETIATDLTGQTLVYELASPQTYSLTANQVRTLLGYNAIWANSGNVSVTYRKGSLADLTSMTNVESRTLSTLSMLAPIEFSPATSAHAVDDVFIVGNKLYKATASIAQGAEIVEGTNVTQTTIMTALQSATGVSF